MPPRDRPQLLVLGTGFGAFSLCKTIDTRLYRVTVVSPRNHFLFTPLLPSTTVGTVEFRSIIEPIRSACPEVTYYEASCTSIDPGAKSAACDAGGDSPAFSLPYDLLVVAVGSVSNTFGVPGVRDHALFLKDLADARAIRQRIIGCFEEASRPDLPAAERARLLHFAVVGGGPTGVEFAAEMHDFLMEDLPKSYGNVVNDVRITLFEAGPTILSTFDAALQSHTLKIFRRSRIQVRTGSLVVRVERGRIVLGDGSDIPCGMVVWSTGIGPTSLLESLAWPRDRAGRLLADACARVNGVTDIYALGDCAAMEGIDAPPTAQLAQQQGKYLASALNRMAAGKQVRPFRFHHYGMLAYIGGGDALADLKSVKGKGFPAFLFWRSAYLTRLVSVRNKILVLFDWCKTLVFGRDASRF